MEDNIKNDQPTQAQINPELNMGAHDPKVDLVRNNNLFKKSLFVAGGFVLILIVICTLQYCSSQSGKADMSKADYAMMTAMDSTQRADAVKMYNKIADNSNSTEAQRAKIFSAGEAYAEGNYEAALNYIKDVNTKSPIVQTLKFCMEGDCYINLDKIDEGIAALKNAVSEADENPELAPYALQKLANAYRYKKDYKNELPILQELMKKYPDYNPQIESEIARAEALAK